MSLALTPGKVQVDLCGPFDRGPWPWERLSSLHQLHRR
jgi:hypothetical protein